MALKIKIDPVERFTEAMVRADLSNQQQKKEIADFVRAGIAEADQTNQRVLGRIPPRTITVDGSHGAALEDVNPNGGTIIVEYELIGEVLIWIAKTLEDRSPVTSGAYKKGHTLYADGVPTDVTGTVPPAEIYTFINTVPYARKIEVGKTKSGRSFVIQVPNKIYERTAKDAKLLFGKTADITSSFDFPVGGYQLKRDQASRSFTGGKMRILRGQRPDRVKGSYINVPAILVKFKKA
jgi:hypothetical protein